MVPELSPQATSSLFEMIADEHRRCVVEYLSTSSDDVASASEIADYLATNCPSAGNPEQAAVRLHHVILPKLKETGLVDYDPRSKTVRYCGDSEVVDLLDCLREGGW